MKVSVIIVAYKSGDVCAKCLKSIEEYNDLGNELEVIVVDNSPKDEKIHSYIDGILSCKFQYIEADNSGFGAGNNIGFHASVGEVVVFLNPDIILIEPVFKKIFTILNTEEKIKLLGGKLLNENRESGFSFYYEYNTSFIRNFTIKIWNRLNYFDEKKMFISGANLCVRRQEFEAIGKFDENIFMYYEESDIIRRMREMYPDGVVAFNKDIRLICNCVCKTATFGKER